MTITLAAQDQELAAIRTLDFDCEASPRAVWYEGKPTWGLTAIAACFTDDLDSMQVWLLGEVTLVDMLEGFTAMYEEAGMVSGHNILSYDLPLVNGSRLRAGLPPLAPILAEDTKAQYLKRGPIPASQEYLGEMLGLEEQKVHMSIYKWEEANDLLGKQGLESTRERVVGDVLMHMELRKIMRERGLLKSPRVWRP